MLRQLPATESPLAPADLLLPTHTAGAAAAQREQTMHLQSSLEHARRGMGLQVVLHDVTLQRRLPPPAQRLQLTQLLPPWAEWDQQASSCSIYTDDSPGEAQQWPCKWRRLEQPFTRQAEAEATLLLPPSAGLTVRLRLALDGHRMPSGVVYPSDAHRGFDLPPAHAQLLSADRVPAAAVTHDGQLVSSETAEAAKDTLLQAMGHPLPIESLGPDFSMPYNVVTVSLTILASVGGGLINLLVRWGRLHATQPWPLKPREQ